MFFVVYFTALVVDVLQITFVFEMQVPRDKHILFFELSLAHAFFPLHLLLECPDVYQSYSPDSGDSDHFPDGSDPLLVC